MYPETPNIASEPVDLSAVICAMGTELRCLLGPAIELTTGRLPAGGSARARLRRDEFVDLLRHLALDAHDAMQDGGTITIRTGRLREVADCVAMVIHETRDRFTKESAGTKPRINKGRSLGLGAAYDVVSRAGGHFHVSCRGCETVLTICLPLAE